MKYIKSPMDRAKLVELILSSFSFEDRDNIDSLWAKEAEDRIKAYNEGKIEKISMEDVFSSLDIQ